MVCCNRMPTTLQICNGREAGKVHHEKHLVPLVAFTPKLIMQVSGTWKSLINDGAWKSRILQVCAINWKPILQLKCLCSNFFNLFFLIYGSVLSNFEEL